MYMSMLDGAGETHDVACWLAFQARGTMAGSGEPWKPLTDSEMATKAMYCVLWRFWLTLKGCRETRSRWTGQCDEVGCRVEVENATICGQR